MMEGSSMAAEPERLVDLNEVLEMTGVSASTIYRMEMRGEFPAHGFVGNSKRWVASEVAKWVKDFRSFRRSKNGKRK